MCCVVASPQHQPHAQNQVVHATTPTPHQLQHNPQVGVVHHALQPLCFLMVVVQWWVCCMVDAIVLALSHRCCAFWCVVVHPHLAIPLDTPPCSSLTHTLGHAHTTTVPFGVTFTTTHTLMGVAVWCCVRAHQTTTNTTTNGWLRHQQNHTQTTIQTHTNHKWCKGSSHTLATTPTPHVHKTHTPCRFAPNSTNTTPHAPTMPTTTPPVTTQTRHMLTTTTLCQHTQLHQPPCCQVQTHQTHWWQLAPLVNIANKLIQPIPQQTTHTTKSQTCARLHNTTTTPHLWFVPQPSPPASTVVCGKGGLVMPPTSMCPPWWVQCHKHNHNTRRHAHTIHLFVGVVGNANTLHTRHVLGSHGCRLRLAVGSSAHANPAVVVCGVPCCATTTAARCRVV